MHHHQVLSSSHIIPSLCSLAEKEEMSDGYSRIAPKMTPGFFWSFLIWYHARYAYICAEGELDTEPDQYRWYFHSLNTLLCRFELLPCTCLSGYMASYVTSYITKSNNEEEEERNTQRLIHSDKIMKALPLLFPHGSQTSKSDVGHHQ